MGNQGKMERNSKVCVEVQNDENYSWYTILGVFYLPKQKICTQRCGRIKLERMAILEIILLNKISAIHFL